MTPKPEYRVIFYMVCWAAVTGLFVQGALAHSQAAYDGGDLSAFAWTGFMPFVFPLFMIDAAFWVLPAVVLIEVVLFAVWYFRGSP